MKSLIVYCSDYNGNTERIAKLFAEKLGAELINAKEVNSIEVQNYDLIGFGSGVYRESMSPKLFKLVHKLDLKGKSVFVFSTSGVGMKFYNNRLNKLLGSKEAICKGSFACKGSFISRDFSNNKIFEVLSKFSKGHPNDNDLKEAERFISQML